jgi:hypothetical protein
MECAIVCLPSRWPRGSTKKLRQRLAAGPPAVRTASAAGDAWFFRKSRELSGIAPISVVGNALLVRPGRGRYRLATGGWVIGVLLAAPRFGWIVDSWRVAQRDRRYVGGQVFLTVIRDELRATEAVPASLLAVGLAAAAVPTMPVSPAREANRLSSCLGPALDRAVLMPSVAGRAQVERPSAPAATNFSQRTS